MVTMSRRASLALFGIVACAGGLLARASGQEAKPDRKSPRERTRARYFPNVVLTTHEGKKVRFYDELIKGKIVTINFTYAECERVCLPVTANLARVQKLLGNRVGRDIFMYSITLRPEQDTPAVLKKYAEMHRVKPGWWFLTGDPHDIELLRRKLGYLDPDPEVDEDKSQHIGIIRYGNEPFQWWGACPGLADPQWIVTSILWVDAPKSRPASG